MQYDSQLLHEVARLRYHEKLNQNSIAERLNLSRPTISRILAQAEDRGIVKITVYDPMQDMRELANALQETFDLKDAHVVNTHGQDERTALATLGKAGGEYLIRLLRPNDILGVAWGETTLAVARHIPNFYVENLRVVSVNGCTYEHMYDEGLFAVVRLFGQKLGGTVHLLYAPVIVSSLEVKNVYLSEKHTRRTMECIAQCNLMLNGIGNFRTESLLYRYGYVNAQEWETLERNHTVGNIGSLYYNIDGQSVNSDLDARTIGATFEMLRNTKQSIGIACGVKKVMAIIGALRGKLCNILITNQDTARALLDMNKKLKLDPLSSGTATE